MPLTPAEVHNVAFQKSPIGKRGYDEDEVDAFLDLIEAELTRLIEQNNDLQTQVEDMQRSGPPGPMPPVPMSPAPAAAVVPSRSDESSRVVKVLAMAQETAERYEANAKAEADRTVSEAKAASDRMIGEARGKADAMTAEASSRAEAVEREARDRAAAVTEEAERKHNEIIGRLERRKTTLETRVAELRTFERDYRARLTSYLESQLRDLDDGGTAEPATAAAAAAADHAGRQESSVSDPARDDHRPKPSAPMSHQPRPVTGSTH